MRYVSLGGPIFLGVVGAILAFAVSDQMLGPIDLSVVGVILLVAAAIWLILSVTVNRPQRRVRTVRRDTPGGQAGYGGPGYNDNPPTRQF